MRGNLRKRLSSFLHISGNYRKNLIGFLLLASIPGITFSLLIFFVSKTQLEKELQTVNQNHLYNTIDSIKGQFSDLERLVANLAVSANMQNYSDLSVVHDYQKIRDIYDMLNLMEGYEPLIGRAELFLNRPNPMVYTKHGYALLEDEQQIEDYSKLLTSNKKIFWDQSHTSIEKVYEDQYAPIVLVHKLDHHIYGSFGSLIVFLNQEKLGGLLQSPYEDGSVFLLRNNNKWVFGKKNQTQPDSLQRTIMEEIVKRTDSPDPFMFHYENIKYTVTYDHFSRLGDKWYYVSIVPMTDITAPVVFISRIFLYLSLFVFTLAICLSLFASRKLYGPIEKLTSKVGEINPFQSKNEFELIETQLNHLSTESNDLQKRLEQQLPHLRVGFLLQLIQGYLYTYNEEELQDRMLQFGTDYTDKKYVIAFTQMFGFSKLKDRFAEGDEGLVTFLAVNIAEELINQSPELEADVINFHDLSLGILFSFSSDIMDDEIDEKVVRFCDELIGYINNICKMKVSVGVSRIIESLKYIHSNFEETKASLNFRNLQEDNQIIEMKKIDDLIRSHGNFEYPFDLELEIIHAIRQRNQEEAINLVNKFFTTLTEQNVSEAIMKQGSQKLLGSIFHIVLQSGMIEDFVIEGANLYEELYKLKDLDEISYWFEKKVITPIIDELLRNQNQRLRMSVQKVMDILEANYMKNDISLDFCANEVNLNPTILSKVFKEISGWNFIDYLTHLRVTKAKEMLLETDTKIKDIAESIGYNHSYFNRIFKRQEGITPSGFREMNRKNII